MKNTAIRSINPQSAPTRSAVCILVFALLSCGSGGPETTSEAQQTGVSQSTVPDNPCDILNDDLLHRYFETGDAEISRSQSGPAQNPICSVSWPKPDADARTEAYQKQIMQYMIESSQNKDVSLPRLKATNEIHLTLNATRFDNAAAAEGSFDSAMRILSEGMTVEVQGQAVETPRYTTTEVSGVGTKAMWVSGLNQLSVLSGSRIFHVGVSVFDDATMNLEKAKTVALEVAKVVR